MSDADVIVVGLGVAGEAIAGKLAEAGLSVIGIEAELVGGECPYWGCIPTKMMIRAADALTEARRVGELAGSADVLALPESMQFGGWLGLLLLAVIAWLLFRTAMKREH